MFLDEGKMIFIEFSCCFTSEQYSPPTGYLSQPEHKLRLSVVFMGYIGVCLVAVHATVHAQTLFRSWNVASVLLHPVLL